MKWYSDGTEVPTDEGTPYLGSVIAVGGCSTLIPLGIDKATVGSRRMLSFTPGEHYDAA
jgi:hypothetical protein